jgi:hypothetical protein
VYAKAKKTHSDALVADRDKRTQVVIISRQKQNDTLVLGC